MAKQGHSPRCPIGAWWACLGAARLVQRVDRRYAVAPLTGASIHGRTGPGATLGWCQAVPDSGNSCNINHQPCKQVVPEAGRSVQVAFKWRMPCLGIPSYASRHHVLAQQTKSWSEPDNWQLGALKQPRDQHRSPCHTFCSLVAVKMLRQSWRI
ncbi:hypothetical protein WJX73_007518 [Symbiochloris irregularis]|uniref:Uncharacterized protein n=1 Tax=Symbiochloris irregularis TaxID=706552 RepID=A0AAW1PR89_9CHLO